MFSCSISLSFLQRFCNLLTHYYSDLGRSNPNLLVLTQLTQFPFPFLILKGRLPLEFLNDDVQKCHAALANAQQLRASYEALHSRQMERILSWRFQSFQPLEPDLGVTFIKQINNSINNGLYKESVINAIH